MQDGSGPEAATQTHRAGNPRTVFVGVFLGTLLGLVIVKRWLRPIVLAQDGPDWLQVFVLSFPNFCEAVLGSFLVFGLLQTLQNRLRSPTSHWPRPALILLTVLLAGAYVLSQEAKLHHIGGNNVYDPNDVVFSVVGILATAAYLAWSRFELNWAAN